MKVLLIDDEPLIRRGLKRMLDTRYETTAVGDCEAAYELIRAANVYDAILVDYHLPTLMKIQDLVVRIGPRAARRLILMSGDTEALPAAAIEAAEGRVLYKPITLLGMMNLIELVSAKADLIDHGDRCAELFSRHVG